MTQTDVSAHIINRIDKIYSVSGKVLDPCRGQGSFYNQYPSSWDKDWCELDEGRDFFSYSEPVDWIISNPPYSIFREWLRHSFTICDNIVYLIPIAKVVGSKTIIGMINEYGGVVDIYPKWSGREIGFPFGFPCGSVYFKKGYTKPAQLFFNFV